MAHQGLWRSRMVMGQRDSRTYTLMPSHLPFSFPYIFLSLAVRKSVLSLA